MRRLFAYALAATLATPSFALASSTTDVISELAGLFYIIVGLTLVAAILLMVGGGIVWLIRLGTDETYRIEGIHMMEWGVATLFTLILVLGIVEFIQSHTQATLYIISVCIVLLVIWAAVASGLFEGGEKEEE